MDSLAPKWSKLEEVCDSKNIAKIVSVGAMAPFEMLPNEVIMIPIKMAMGQMNTQQQLNFLREVLPNVSKRFKTVSTLKPLWKGFSPFELLPDSVASKIIRGAMADLSHERKAVFLVDVMARVSTRLKYVSCFPSVVSQVNLGGNMEVDGDTDEIKWFLKDFLREGMTGLRFKNRVDFLLNNRAANSTSISTNEITDMAKKCPKLKNLETWSIDMGIWPQFSQPWASLTSLKLIEIHQTISLFDGVELHQSLPNIETIHIRYYNPIGQISLPNMRHCNSMKSILIGTEGLFTTTGFPRSLEKLRGDLLPTIVGICEGCLEQQFDKCEISTIKFDNCKTC